VTQRRLLLRAESAEHMREWAAQWVQTLAPGTVLALQGGLGAGKTTFTGGLVAGIMPEERVSSPTFGYLHVYGQKNLRIAHFDCYRIQSAEDFSLMGWDEVIEQAYLSIVEWPERCHQFLPAKTMYLQFEHKGEHREIWQVLEGISS
jgi:tRNA threonylcarbamoyladenosine biosynthesis protein TsaE